MGKFIRDIPHVIWLFILTLVLLWAYIYTRDEAIKNLLIGAASAMVALSKAAPSSMPAQVRANVEGDLNVADPPKE